MRYRPGDRQTDSGALVIGFRFTVGNSKNHYYSLVPLAMCQQNYYIDCTCHIIFCQKISKNYSFHEAKLLLFKIVMPYYYS